MLNSMSSACFIKEIPKCLQWTIILIVISILPQGIFVCLVIPGSPAAMAGLRFDHLSIVI